MELVKVEDYAVVQRGADVLDVIRTNLGDEGLSLQNLDSVGIPTGGSRSWTVDTLEGEQQASEIVGVIVHAHNSRAYWPDKYEGGNDPPQCTSPDARIGYGKPGGECYICPFAEWGSDPNSRGQACSLRKNVYLVQPDSLLPLHITLAPTSVQPMQKYFMRLASKAIPYFGVVTSLALETTTNAGGIKFSVVAPRLVERLDPDELDVMRGYSDQIREMIDRTAPRPSAP